MWPIEIAFFFCVAGMWAKVYALEHVIKGQMETVQSLHDQIDQLIFKAGIAEHLYESTDQKSE